MEPGRDPEKLLSLRSAKSKDNHPSKLSRIVPVKALSFKRRIPVVVEEARD